MALVTEAIRTEVAQLYVALFGRAPLSEGLGFYSQKVASGMSVPQVAQEMFNLDVARSYYPLEATAEQVITSFFTNVLGRTPEAGGLSYWVGRLNAANALNPDTAEGVVIAEMIDSVVAYSGSNAVALSAQALFNNKVEVALAFRDAQTSNPEGGHPYNLSNEVLLGVSDDILKTVTATNVAGADLFVDSFLNTYFGRTLTVSAQDATEGEGNVVFKLELSAAPALPITVTVSTGAAGDTATSGADYTAVSQQITFAAGQTVQYVTVNVNDDNLVESAENVTLNVSGPVNVTVTGDRVAQITSNDVANQAPVAQSAAVAAEEGGDVVNGAVLATDVDGDALTYAVVGAAPAGLTFNANGSFSFNPKVGAYDSLAAGAVEIKTVTYAVSDGVNAAVNGTLTITITGTNDGPVAQAVIASGLEDAATIAVTPVSADVDAGDTAAYTVNTQPSNGTVSFNALTGKFDYTPKANFNGVDSFTYKVTDGSGATSVAAATVTVTSVNDAPVALGGAASATEGGVIVYGAVTGSDLDGDALSYSLNGAAPAGLTFNANGTFSFDPAVAAYNALDAGDTQVIEVQYTVADGKGGSAVGTLTLTVAGSNDVPVAEDVRASGLEDAAQILVTPVSRDVDADDTAAYAVNSQPANGTVSFDAVSGKFVYVPNANFNGVDSFTYRVTDSQGAVAVANATVTVASVNDAPVALGGAGSAAEGGAIVYGTVTGSDVDGQTLSYAVNGTAPAGLTFNANGSFSFDPRDPAYDSLVAGEVKTITVGYTVSDNHPTDPKSDNTGVLTITLVGTNDAPTAQAVVGSGNEDTTISVAPNVADVDLTDTHTFSVALNPSNGTVSFNAVTGKFDYVPNADFNGIDSFTYRVTDNNGASATAVATVTVNPVNDAPVAGDVVLLPGVTGRAYTFTEDQLLSRATDVDGDMLNVTEVRDSSNNVIAENLDANGQPNGTWTFVPELFDQGESFTVTVSDGNGGADTLTATVVFGDSIFNLTSRRDVEQGYHVYNSQPEYTPGGTDLVNTLQDEDSLVGTSQNDDSLNVILGGPNDGSESIVTPVLNSIEVVNAQFTGGGSYDPLLLKYLLGGTTLSPIWLDSTYGIDFQNTTGVREVNVDRVTDSNAQVVLLSLQDSTDTLSVSNATRQGVIEFNWAEGMLAAPDDVVTLTLDRVRLDALLLTAGDNLSDVPEDEGYGIEELYVVVNGTSNIDEFVLFPNGAEQVAGPASPSIGVVPPGAHQLVDFTTNVGAALEINSLVMPGVETIAIHAAAPVLFTGNERTNVDGNDNNGLDRSVGAFTMTGDLERIEIDGTAAGDVWLNGVNSGSDDGDYDVVIEGSEMQGNLAVRIENLTAFASDSSVDSGAGDDEIVTTGTSNMAITTRDGADHVHIGRFGGGDSNDVIRTGAGADRVEVMGTIRGDVDTWSAFATNVTGTAVGIDTAADGDHVWAHGLHASDDNADIEGANVWTGEGNDTITVDDAITNPAIPTMDAQAPAPGMIPTRVINMANGNDVLTVEGEDGDVSLAAGYEVEMGEGNDLATFAADIAGTVSTSGGNDTVTVGDGVLEGSGITTGEGNDRVIVGDDVSALIDTGNGDDYIQTGNASENIYDGDVEGPGAIETHAGNDTVNVGGDLDVAYEDYVGDNAGGPSDDDGITTETASSAALNVPGTGKLAGEPDRTTTVAARIETGTGNDVVNVDGILQSAAQWNDNQIEAGKVGDFNADDTINIIGAKILLGDGNDRLTIGDYDQRSDRAEPAILEEGTLIDAGKGDDTVVIHHNGPVVLARDNSEFNEFGKSSAAQSGGILPGTTYDVFYVEREVAVGAPLGKQDTTGAMVYLGEGNDNLTFNDVAFDVSGNPAERPAADSKNTYSGQTILVDRGAIVDGSAAPGGAPVAPADETDTLTVRTVDDIDVVRSRHWHAIDTKADVDTLTDAIVVGGLNAKDAEDGQGGYIRNIDVINLVIENSVTPFQENSGAVAGTPGGSNDPAVAGYVATDNEESLARIRLDVFQVNTDLEEINLVSLEQRMLLEDTKALQVEPEAKDEDPYYVDGHSNGYIAGTRTEFEIDAHRQDVGITLKAYEVTGLTPWRNGDHDEDGKLDGTAWPYEGFAPPVSEWAGEGEDLRDDCETDVTVMVNMDRYADGNNRGFTLTLERNPDITNATALMPGGQTGEHDYDVEIISEDEYATGVGGAVVTTQQDLSPTGNTSSETISAEGMTAQPVNADADKLSTDGLLIRQYAREITLEVDTGASHAIHLNRTFVGNDILLGGNTSLTVNVNAPATLIADTFQPQTIQLTNVRADLTTVTGDADLFVHLRNDAAGGQAFKVDLSETTGTNLIDMTGDGTDPDKAFDDTVLGGSGDDLLLLNGGTDIAGFSNPAGPVIDGIERLALIFQEGSEAEESNLTVDASGDLDEILIVNHNRGDQGIADQDDSVPGGLSNGFHTVNVVASGSAVGSNALTINADIDISDDLLPEFCNPALESTRHSDGLLINVETTNALVRTDVNLIVNVAEGTQIRLKNDENEFARVYATVSALANTYVNDNVDPLFNALGDEEGELRLTVLGGGVDEIYLVENKADNQGTEGNNVFVKVENSWATNVNTTGNAHDLLIDASAIDDTDNSTFNVWNEFDGRLETDANLYIKGTQGRDDIDGGAQRDTLDGQGGNDLIYGGKGNDLLIGGTGNDQLAGDYDGDTIANGGNDTLLGGTGVDLLYGGVKADVLTGGADNDVFIYTRRADSNSGFDVAGIDVVTDFNANGELTDLVAGTDLIDVRYLAFDPAFLEGISGPTIGQFLTGKKMVFGLVDEVSSLLLGGNGKNFADAQSRTFSGNGIIEVAYQQDEQTLWFDLNDDGTLNNNDLRIRVPLPAGAPVNEITGLPEFQAEWIAGVYANGNGSTNFFGAVYADPAQNDFQPYALGTVVSDHIIVDASRQNVTTGLVNGLLAGAGSSSGALATFGGNDQVTVVGSDVNDDLIIDLGDGNDTLRAGEGDETLYGGDGNDSIAAGGGDDFVFGGNGDDTVFGEAGNDYIEATPGNDYLDGGEGNDTLKSSSGNDTLLGGAGNDSLVSGDAADFDHGEGDRDYVDGGEGDDFISTGNEADTVYGGFGEDVIFSGAGNDWVDAGEGEDYVESGAGADTVYGGGGEDVIDSGADDDRVWGGAGADSILAGGGADWVDAGTENDTVLGGVGADTIYGDQGLDHLFGGSDADYIDGGSDDDIIGGDEGNDTLIGGLGNDSVAGGEGDDSITGNEGNDQIVGGEGNDAIDAGIGNDSVTGDGGNDSILAGDGQDTVRGGLGADTVRGQDGDDQIWGNEGADVITGGNGNDSVWGGADGDSVTGDAGDDSIFGESGNDTIDAGTGNDTVSGGADDDWIHGRNGNDSLIGDGGNDTIYGGDPTDSLEDADTIRGGAGNDIAWGYDDEDLMQGNAGNDTLYGGDESDTIGGGADDDLLYGDEQDDFMFGGWMLVDDGPLPTSMVGYNGSDEVYSIADTTDGDDTLYGGIGNDSMVGGSYDDILVGGTGNDRLWGDWDGRAGAFENLPGFGFSDDYTDLYAGQDSILGGDGLDTIEGGFGDDTIDGGSGADLIYGEYLTGEDNFHQLIDPSLVSATLPGIPAAWLNGNDDLIFGGDGNDTIFGDISADLANLEGLRGIGGNDTIDGGSGDDSILGGGGNDSIDGGIGNDSIHGGYGSDSIWGNVGDDWISGWNGADYLSGGAGSDSIAGDDGNDTIDGGSEADRLLGGNDQDSIAGGDGNDSIWGEAGNDTLYGEGGADSIDGGTGNDWASGGDANDSIFGDTGDDTLYGDGGNDYLDGGANDDSLMGGEGNDTLLGGTGDDWIWGEAGDDSLLGGDGSDSLFGGLGDDRINLVDALVGEDMDDVDYVHLNVATTTNDSLTSNLGDDTIDGFDTRDPDGATAGPDNFDGDYLVLLKGDVSNGQTKAVVMVTDWSNDVMYRTQVDEQGNPTYSVDDYFDTYYDQDPAFETVGPDGRSIADASLVIVRTAWTSNDARAQVGPIVNNFVDGAGDPDDDNFGLYTDGDFDFNYTTAQGVDNFLRAQNGKFDGSVFVLTDNAGVNESNALADSAGDLVYLWWDRDVSDNGAGLGVVDTVLVGTFTSIENAEAFLENNVLWVDSFPL